MTNQYPIFERNRILKKEMLGAIRDYTFAHARLQYQGHAPGIIQGCEVTSGDHEIAVSPGIVKCGTSVCLLDEGMRIGYGPHEQVQYLKIRIRTDCSSPDSVIYRAELLLDTDPVTADDEFELCRFSLRTGARLRYQYKDLADMETEYDTVNLLHASFGGLGGRSLSPAITSYFAETVLGSEDSGQEDRAFAWLCLSQPGAVAPAVLSSYIRKRMGISQETAMGNVDIYRALCSIAGEICRGGRKETGKARGRRMVLVD